MRYSQLVLGGVCAATFAHSSFAQTAERQTLEEVVVTAQKREERLQDVALSVSAVDGESLVNQNLVDIADFATRVPNLVVNGTEAYGLSIRGITTGGPTNPSVAVTIDDVQFGSSYIVAQSRTPDMDPTDLERIEVLRGPQGTLYGASSLGGLIKYVTVAPSSTEFSGSIRVGAESVSEGEEAYSVRGGINVPIVQDKLGLRVSGFHRDEPGYIDNSFSGQEDVNDATVYGYRAALQFTPTETISVTLAALQQKREFNENSASDLHENLQPVTDYLAHSEAPGAGYDQFRLYTANITVDTPIGALTSLSGWGEGRSLNNLDLTAQLAAVLPLLGFPPTTVVDYAQNLENDKFVQELRLASPTGGAVEWLIGAFYSDEENQVDQLIDAVDPTGDILGNLITADLPITYRETAVFANGTFRFSESADIQVGARYGENEQSIGYNVSGILSGGQISVLGRSDESNVTWQVTPRYHFNEDTMAYLRVATGYRPGGPNTPIPPTPPTFKSDETTNYELGLKGSAIESRLTYDVAVYWIDWDDVQLYFVSPTTGLSFLDNGEGALSKGVEGSATFRATPGLTLGGNFVVADTELRDDLPPITGVGLAGDRLPGSPQFSANLTADQTFELANGYQASVGATVVHVGERKGLFLPSNAQPDASRFSIESYTALDLRAGVRSDNGFGIDLFVQNVTDERGWSSGDYQTLGFPEFGYSVTVIKPRTIGVILSKNF